MFWKTDGARSLVVGRIRMDPTIRECVHILRYARITRLDGEGVSNVIPVDFSLCPNKLFPSSSSTSSSSSSFLYEEQPLIHGSWSNKLPAHGKPAFRG